MDAENIKTPTPYDRAVAAYAVIAGVNADVDSDNECTVENDGQIWFSFDGTNGHLTAADARWLRDRLCRLLGPPEVGT